MVSKKLDAIYHYNRNHNQKGVFYQSSFRHRKLQKRFLNKHVKYSFYQIRFWSRQYLNQAISWTIIKVNGQYFNYEIIPDETVSEGTVSDFSSFIKVKSDILYIRCKYFRQNKR